MAQFQVDFSDYDGTGAGPGPLDGLYLFEVVGEPTKPEKGIEDAEKPQLEWKTKIIHSQVGADWERSRGRTWRIWTYLHAKAAFKLGHMMRAMALPFTPNTKNNVNIVMNGRKFGGLIETSKDRSGKDRQEITTFYTPAEYVAEAKRRKEAMLSAGPPPDEFGFVAMDLEADPAPAPRQAIAAPVAAAPQQVAAAPTPDPLDFDASALDGLQDL